MNAALEATIAWTPCPTDRDFLLGEPGGYAIAIKRRGSGTVLYYSIRQYAADESWALIHIVKSLDKAKAAAEVHYAKWGRRAAR